jgi:site-specific recombinase XerD
MSAVAPTLQAFFTDRLARQRRVSPQTVASYRDTFRLLLRFVHDSTGKAPSTLDWDDLDAEVISTFLDHLELERHNSARTRNLRLTAIRSLFRYAALSHPEHAAVIQRVLAIPAKRFDRRTITYLTAEEAAALIDAPTKPAGKADETGRCSRSGCSLAYASRSSQGSIAPTWSSAPERTSAAKAKGGSEGRSP